MIKFRQKMTFEVGRVWKKDLVAEKREYAAAALRKAQRAAHAKWRGEAPPATGPKSWRMARSVDKTAEQHQLIAAATDKSFLGKARHTALQEHHWNHNVILVHGHGYGRKCLTRWPS